MKKHLEHIYDKLGVPNRTAAARMRMPMPYPLPGLTAASALCKSRRSSKSRRQPLVYSGLDCS